MSFFNEKIVIQKSPTISKGFVPTETCFFFKLCSRLSPVSFFQTIQKSLATPCIQGFLMSLTTKSNKMTLLEFRLYPFPMLTSTDKKCDNARVY